MQIDQKVINLIKESGLFDVSWYTQNYHDVSLLSMDPIEHYLTIGEKLGRDPSAEFSSKSYFTLNPDVKTSGMNALTHYVLFGKKENRPIKKSAPPLKNQIRGALDPSLIGTTIPGWLADIGNNAPRVAKLLIDNTEFLIEAALPRADLVKAKINNGNHAFEFIVPIQFINKKPHNVKLIDALTGKIVSERKYEWDHGRSFSDFSGFLAYSITNPVINAPFREEDKRCFAIMENIANYLEHTALSLPRQPLVSIIMPSHNRISTIKEAVDSVLHQSYKNFELIIIDDKSSDGTYEFIQSLNDPRILVIRNDVCRGVSPTRNIGLKEAKGDYICYLDSDNTWDKRFIAAIVAGYALNPEASAVYTAQLLYKGSSSTPFAVRFGAFNKSLLSNRNYIDLNCFSHTREIGEKIKFFDTSLKRYVDWDLTIRISEIGKIFSLPAILSNYFLEKADNTITGSGQHSEQIEIIKQNIKFRDKTKRFDRKNKLHLTKRISIIIPSYESLQDIKECIDSVHNNYSNDMVDVIVVDNNSSEEVVNYLKLEEKNNRISTVFNSENFGFTYAVNQGIAISDPQSDIVLLNNDALLEKSSLEHLQSAAYTLPDCGLVVPQQVLPGGTKTITAHVPYANPAEDCDVNISSHHKNAINIPLFHSGTFTEISFAPFFCVYIKRDVLNNSLGLDPEFGRHYRSDRIFCDYIRHVMKLKIYHVQDSIVYHKLQKSTDMLRSDEKKADEFSILFKKNQWPEDLQKKLGFKTAPWDI